MTKRFKKRSHRKQSAGVLKDWVYHSRKKQIIIIIIISELENAQEHRRGMNVHGCNHSSSSAINVINRLCTVVLHTISRMKAYPVEITASLHGHSSRGIC